MTTDTYARLSAQFITGPHTEGNSCRELKGGYIIVFDSHLSVETYEVGDDQMTDFERKVYRIIFNMIQFGKTPSLDELKRKTGKDERANREAVKNLMKQRMLKWDKNKNKWMF